MRNKKLVLAAVIVLILIIAVFALLLYFNTRTPEKVVTPEGEPFADTSAERNYDTSTIAEDQFTDIGPEWLTGARGDSGSDVTRFRIVEKSPVAGAGFYTPDTIGAAQSFLRYTLISSGHSQEVPVDQVGDPKPITQNTILRVGDAKWSRDAKSMLVRYFDERYETVFSFVGGFSTASIASSTSAAGQSFEGRTLPTNVVSAAMSPDGKSIFYIIGSETGSVGIIESVSTGNSTKVWSSPLTHLTTSWNTPTTILVQTNPSLVTPGIVWFVDPVTWRDTVVLSNQLGLAAQQSPDGKRILHSMREEVGNIYSLRSLDFATNEITYLPLPTLAEKCVWSNNYGEYLYCAVPRNINSKDFLEEWYKGRVESDDVIWRFNAKTGTAKRILDPSEDAKIQLDMVDLIIDRDDKYLAFRTKQAKTLWAVELPRDIQVTASGTSSSGI